MSCCSNTPLRPTHGHVPGTAGFQRSALSDGVILDRAKLFFDCLLLNPSKGEGSFCYDSKCSRVLYCTTRSPSMGRPQRRGLYTELITWSGLWAKTRPQQQELIGSLFLPWYHHAFRVIIKLLTSSPSIMNPATSDQTLLPLSYYIVHCCPCRGSYRTTWQQHKNTSHTVGSTGSWYGHFACDQ